MSKYTSLKENINVSISMHETVTCKANLCRICNPFLEIPLFIFLQETLFG